MKFRYLVLIIIGLGLVSVQTIMAQKVLETQISDSLSRIVNAYTYVGKVNGIVISPNVRQKTLTVSVGDKLTNLPFRPDNVKRIYKAIRTITAAKYPGYEIVCQINGRKIDDYIPNYYRTAHPDTTMYFRLKEKPGNVVTPLSRQYDITRGLDGRNIALWNSHGWYYDQKEQKWMWQRSRFFQSVEDLLTTSFVLPYLVPMLENAGAYVLLPRERDMRTSEIIVDNDGSSPGSDYSEKSGANDWKTTDSVGFANKKKIYVQGENPFKSGTCRFIETVTERKEAGSATWSFSVPEEGYYSVYVSYRTLPNSADDALYTVRTGNTTLEFKVNQTMGSGTWIYLGKFYFQKNAPQISKIILTNLSTHKGAVVTADAVKVGGGFGNIGRTPFIEPLVIDSTLLKNLSDSLRFAQSKPDSARFKTRLDSLQLFINTSMANRPKPSESMISHYPRFAEGSRYWLQWAGVPDSVYSRTGGRNDYSDDFQSRGFWVNYLAGGSSVLPDSKGLKIPVELSLAFHTDAGTVPADSVVGTLGICTVQNTNGEVVFKNGASRWTSRDFTDIVQSQIVDDIRRTFNKNWTRRGLWNKSYSESRVPEVPSTLVELLAHQNFADMKYALDPRFRFTVGRAIYKGILRYISSEYNQPYTVQPLPVTGFFSRFAGHNQVYLQWKAVTDTLEPTAKADSYILYTRVDGKEFDNGIAVRKNHITLPVQPGKIYSYKVTAVNEGGESFPSEILSVGKAIGGKGEVLILNGFDRVSAPETYKNDSAGTAGFRNDIDGGVPWFSDVSFVGKQTGFDISRQYVNLENPGFGASGNEYEGKIVVGNTFDYPFVHGRSVLNAGYSFVSCSNEAVEKGSVDLKDYKMVDLILGKQKTVTLGNTTSFDTWPNDLQQKIQKYCRQGGDLLVSGSYVVSGMDNKSNFAGDVLKCKAIGRVTTQGESLTAVQLPLFGFNNHPIDFYTFPNEDSYFVEQVDAIEPADKNGKLIFTLSGSGTGTGIIYSGNYRAVVLGFPFETVKSAADRDKLMSTALQFLGSK